MHKLVLVAIVGVALVLTRCSGQDISSMSKESESTTSEQIKVIQDHSKTTGYGAGDVVADGLLDKAGNLWFVTTKEGVYRYDGKFFTNFSESDGLNSNEVWSVIEDKDGILWFGTADGLCKYDGKTFTHVPVPGGDDDSKLVLSLLEDRHGNIWVGTCGSGAYCYDGKTFTSYPFEKGPDLIDIRFIVEDRDKNIWFGGRFGILWRYDGETFTNFTSKAH